ncbi:MAG: bifunctional nuclease family protein [Phycisphaerae bacterium]
MELSRILITELGDQQVIFLREKGGKRTFPIMIGIAEALAIDRRLKGKPTPRPMTHDLLASVISAMGGQLVKIVVNDIIDHTFIATLHIRRGAEMIRVDSRPSDAIALGVAFDTPIYVSEHVLDNVLNEPPTKEDRIELLRRRMEMLGVAIGELTERLDDTEFLTNASADEIDEHRRQLAEMKQEYDAIDRVLKKLG